MSGWESRTGSDWADPVTLFAWKENKTKKNPNSHAAVSLLHLWQSSDVMHCVFTAIDVDKVILTEMIILLSYDGNCQPMGCNLTAENKYSPKH